MFQKIIISILLIFFSGCGNEKRVNIVYILADDLGYGELGVYGQEIIETPNIDELAKKGMLFTDHYSGSPVCAPSRSVFLTGQILDTPLLEETTNGQNVGIHGIIKQCLMTPLWKDKGLSLTALLQLQRF